MRRWLCVRNTQADIINRGMSGYNSRWALQVRLLLQLAVTSASAAHTQQQWPASTVAALP
jgi:hypothetical protein